MTRRARCGARPRPARPSCVALSWALDAEANGTDFPSGTEEASQCVFSVCVWGGAPSSGAGWRRLLPAEGVRTVAMSGERQEVS